MSNVSDILVTGYIFELYMLISPRYMIVSKYSGEAHRVNPANFTSCIFVFSFPHIETLFV